MSSRLRVPHGCQATDEGCLGDVWPDEDWVIFDTPVGAFELVICERHYEAYERGDWTPTAGLGWARVIEMVADFPVVHGSRG